MTIKDNPWELMNNGSQRRASLVHDIYWIKEEIKGQYGMKISMSSSSVSKLNLKDIKLKNIDIIENKSGGEIDCYLVLKDQSAYELFYSLCNDLIIEAGKNQDKKLLITIIINRLKKWKNLFANNYNEKLSMENQMGLFSELDTLLNYVAKKYSIKEAIHTWKGPELDKQDFILENLALEVKSHKSGKTESITISSPYQLYSTKPEFFLRVYSLDNQENGLSIEHLLRKIRKILRENNLYNEINMLELKVNQYGYFDVIHEKQLLTFKIDKISIYNVDNKFPKISVNEIPEEIINLKYQIDLVKCKDFLINEDL